MKVVTLDQCVRSVMASTSKPIHRYFLFLKLATDCLFELHRHTLKSSRLIPVTIGENGAVTIPCSEISVIGLWNHNRRSSEADGKLGIRRIEGNQLYIEPARWTNSEAWLEFETDEDCDAASKIDFRAKRTIETYIIWKSSPNKDNINSPEAQAYSGQLRVLRANRFGTTGETLRALLRQQTHWNPEKWNTDPINNHL